MHVYLLDKANDFPNPETADSQGLLAVGGEISPECLVIAYKKGIFPWYNPGEPILWWSPDPRLVLFPRELSVTKRLERTIRQKRFTITFDKAFPKVIRACAYTRLEQGQGTWLNEELINSFCHLNQKGIAHSIESWKDGKLVGGLYGMLIGSVFFGESMFFKERDASKVAFVTMVRTLQSLGLKMIDCQVPTTYLMNFGARLIPRSTFLEYLKKFSNEPNILTSISTSNEKITLF